MKFEVEDGGDRFVLRAETGGDLELLCTLVGVHAPGLLGSADQVYCPAEEIAFAWDQATQGLRRQRGGGLVVLCALKLWPDWLACRSPRPTAEELRTNAAARIGHGILDALELVCAHPK